MGFAFRLCAKTILPVYISRKASELVCDEQMGEGNSAFPSPRAGRGLRGGVGAKPLTYPLTPLRSRRRGNAVSF
jgi:hypothetical protein